MRKIAMLLAVLLFSTAAVFAQTQVKGRVTDKDGSPLSGVSVKVKNSETGTTTKADGTFELTTKAGDVLVFTSAGFEPKEAKSSANMSISLANDVKALNEVVVTALQTKRNKNEVVYANQTVRNEELNQVTNKSALNALQGKVAGVKIQQASGALGASTRVVLRGETSLTQGNNALIVVDGVPLNNSTSSGGGGTGKAGDRDNYVDFGNRANDINPDDIEAMTVLKGPAATSLYGSRGASGVILITTKKGKGGRDGRPRVSVNSSYSTDKVYMVYKQQEKFGSGYATCNGCGGGIDIFMGENFSWGAAYDGRIIPWTAIPADADGNLLPLNNGKIEQLSRPYSAVKDNIQNFFDRGHTFRNSVSIDGNDGKYSYFLSYTNYNSKGVVPHTTLDKNNFLFNGNAIFSPKLNSSVSVNYTKLSQRGATEGGYPFGYSSGTPAYSFALQTPANIPFDELRDYNSPYHDFKGFYGQYSINPYFILDQQEVRNTVDNLLASLSVNYTPFKNFTVTGRVSTNMSTSSVTEKNPKFSYFRALSWSDGELSDFESPRNSVSLGSYKESMVRRTDINYDLIGNYQFEVGKDWKFNATAGFNSIEQQARAVAGQTSGGLVIPGFYDLTNSKELPIGAATSTKYRLYGGYFNASAGWRKMLFLEYSARKDWSSTLPKTNRSFFYQAGGISFLPLNAFDAKNDVVNYLKIRANVGTTGKDAPLYQLDNYYSLNPLILDYGDDYQILMPFGGQSGSTRATAIGNPNLKPELTVTTEVGADIGLFKDRLTIEYTYYNINSKNQIVTVNIPWSSGYSFVPLNIGRMKNSGHELMVRGTPIKNRLLEWKLFATFAKNNNKVISVADEFGLKELNIYSGLIHFSGHGSLNMVATEGLPFGTFKGTDFVYDAQGNMVVDGTGNPRQSADLKYLGSYQPKYITSFGTDITIKGFTIHALFDARKGGLFYSGTKVSTEFNGTAITTLTNDRQPYVIPNSVFEDGSKNNKATAAYNYNKATPASAFLLDASYLKFRELSISYNLPVDMLKKSPFSNVGLSVYGKNLKYWLPKENTFADPEVGGVGGGSDAQGIETTTTPSTRSFGIDLKFTFK